MTRAPAVVAAVLAAVVAAGCGPGDEEGPTVTTATTVAVAPPPSDTAAGADPGRDRTPPPAGVSFTTTAVSVPATPHAYLAAVRAARQAGFDRVVFEFERSVPGYRVGFVDGPVVEDGSGEPVPVRGDALLEVHMEAASGAELVGGGVRPTYTGPRRIAPDTPTVTEVVRASDFEANLDWVVGLRRRAPFRVFTLSAPPRLVVDVAHADR